MKLGSVDQWSPPPRRLAELAKRHIFIMVSLTVHAALIALCYYFGSYRIELTRQQQLVHAGAELSKQSSMEKRVLDMKQINDLLEQSGRASDTRQDQTNFTATSLPKAPTELLAEARQLSASIDEVEKRLKADELARIDGISKEQALKQLDVPPPAAAPAPAETATPEQLATEIELLEKRARASLAQRQQDLQRRMNGVAVQPPGSKSGSAYGSGDHENAVQSGANGEQAKDGQVSATPGRNEGELVERIAKFINRDLALPKDASQHYYQNGERIFNPGVGQIPAVDAATMHKGFGRMLGREGEFANRVYVNSWYLIGPFEGKHGSGLFSNYRYPPEDGVVLDAAYRGKENRVVKWRYLNADSYPLVPPDFAEDAVYYGYTELMLDREQLLTMWIGADDDAQIWLNDEQVWAGGNINKTSFWRDLYDTQNTYARDFNMTEGKRKVRFKKGRNKIFFKLANGPSRTFFSLVLTK
ncbi:hypothetical protein GJ699_18795 [Duganella sp. FT80W]|uniref:Uncharacterized protein n=1 Tax=Duganella guangzhouensis TaxID=2666084 RepID=A0A6I2L5W0_9BURK|nr:hypothetical protein [Duganella guangzhouensis]MRW92046.1 hypothetical protein [Duganella guangzhouensis]